MTVTMTVDLNEVNKFGLLKSAKRRADGPIEVGSSVMAVEPYDRVTFTARVEMIDNETGRVLLDVDWDSEAALADDPVAPPTFVAKHWTLAPAIPDAEVRQITPTRLAMSRITFEQRERDDFALSF